MDLFISLHINWIFQSTKVTFHTKFSFGGHIASLLKLLQIEVNSESYNSVLKKHKFCQSILANIYLLKVNNRNTTRRCDICSKLTTKTPERRKRRRPDVFIINFEYISHIFVVRLLLTWTR